jgi:hypothetical protein
MVDVAVETVDELVSVAGGVILAVSGGQGGTNARALDLVYGHHVFIRPDVATGGGSSRRMKYGPPPVGRHG